MFASCWLVPLDCIWSGFRLVESFHFRYSFVVIFLVLYLAAKGIAAYEQEPENKKLAILFVFCIGIFSWFHHKEPYDSKVLFVTLGVLMLYAVIFLIGKERILKYFLPVILAGELILNAVLIFAVNYGTNGTITTYQEYVEQEEKLIEEVKKAENDKFYRMEALQRRNDFGSGCSAYLNQSMVYGYRGLAHYSSAYDANFAKMLFNFGYSGDEVLSGMQESILSSDSLLGIRYLVSKKAVPGYEKLEELPVYNGKSVYYNPYALGFGMEAASSVFDPVESSDPFTYQNQLFSNIMGYEVELFHRIEPRIGLENQTLSFLLPGDNTENQIYGYVDTWIRDLELYIDEEYRCSYAAWLGYKVFSVGQSNQEHLVSLNRFTGAQTDMLPHFYYLDQQVFEKVIQELKGREMQLEVFKDGYIKGSYTASKDGQLLLSMPYDSGWRIFVNGTRVEAKEGVEALEVIPVVEGENQIEMKYYVPGMEIGILLSVIGILMFAGICYLSRKKVTDKFLIVETILHLWYFKERLMYIEIRGETI